MEKVTVTADKTKLKSVGIDYDITGLSGKVKKYYPDGIVVVEIIHDIGTKDCCKFEVTNEFDIPREWLEVNQLLPKRLSNSAYHKAKNSTYEEFVGWWDKQI